MRRAARKRAGRREGDSIRGQCRGGRWPTTATDGRWRRRCRRREEVTRHGLASSTSSQREKKRRSHSQTTIPLKSQPWPPPPPPPQPAPHRPRPPHPRFSMLPTRSPAPPRPLPRSTCSSILDLHSRHGEANLARTHSSATALPPDDYPSTAPAAFSSRSAPAPHD